MGSKNTKHTKDAKKNKSGPSSEIYSTRTQLNISSDIVDQLFMDISSYVDDTFNAPHIIKYYSHLPIFYTGELLYGVPHGIGTLEYSTYSLENLYFDNGTIIIDNTKKYYFEFSPRFEKVFKIISCDSEPNLSDKKTDNIGFFGSPEDFKTEGEFILGYGKRIGFKYDSNDNIFILENRSDQILKFPIKLFAECSVLTNNHFSTLEFQPNSRKCTMTLNSNSGTLWKDYDEMFLLNDNMKLHIPQLGDFEIGNKNNYYTGEVKFDFDNGKISMDGKGKFKMLNGAYFEGDFKNNKMAKGKYVSNDCVYLGTIKNNMFHDKDGKLKYVNDISHDNYQGGFKKGKFHGRGELTYSDKSKYVGNFKDGEKCGTGVYITNGKKFHMLDGQIVDSYENLGKV